MTLTPRSQPDAWQLLYISICALSVLSTFLPRQIAVQSTRSCLEFLRHAVKKKLANPYLHSVKSIF